jgi:hypothetical protein
MPERFSERYGYSKVPLKKIIDDAPKQIRDAFVDLILKECVYVDRDGRYVKGNGILGAKALYEEITSELLIRRNDDYSDSWRVLDILYDLIGTGLEWNQFYDIVEYIGKKLIKIDEIRSKQNVDNYQSTWNFGEFQEKVNSLFNRGGIGWKLGDNSELKLDVPKELLEGIQKTKDSLAQQKPIIGHIEKALKFLTDYHTIDPENAIKEIVSAIEAFGNSVWPKTNTLRWSPKTGQVVKIEFCS